MANKRPPIKFPGLDATPEPKGARAILRSSEEVAAEEALLENQNSGNTENHKTFYKENLNSGNTEIQKSVNRALYTKATYRLNPEAIEAVDEIKRILRRKYGSKVLLEEIVEQVILEALEDLEKNEQSSFLVKKFSGNQESKKY